MTDASHATTPRHSGETAQAPATGLPVMLNVTARRCVIVGGGPVALRRATALLQAGATVMIVAPDIDPAIASLPIEMIRRPYLHGDLDGALLAVIATDDPAVNEQVASEAKQRGVLVNRADDADLGDVAIPAHARLGPLTVAVHTGGTSASASAAIRDQLVAMLDPDWPTLLVIAREFRPLIQRNVPDPAERRRRLARMTDEQAMALLKKSGTDTLRAHMARLADPRQSP